MQIPLPDDVAVESTTVKGARRHFLELSKHQARQLWTTLTDQLGGDARDEIVGSGDSIVVNRAGEDPGQHGAD